MYTQVVSLVYIKKIFYYLDKKKGRQERSGPSLPPTIVILLQNTLQYFLRKFVMWAFSRQGHLLLRRKDPHHTLSFSSLIDHIGAIEMKRDGIL